MNEKLLSDHPYFGLYDNDAKTNQSNEKVAKSQNEVNSKEFNQKSKFNEINEAYLALITFLRNNNRKLEADLKSKIEDCKIYKDFIVASIYSQNLSTMDTKIAFSNYLIKKIDDFYSSLSLDSNFKNDLLRKKRFLTIEICELKGNLEVKINQPIASELLDKRFSVFSKMVHFVMPNSKKAKVMDAVQLCITANEKLTMYDTVHMNKLHELIEDLKKAKQLFKEAKKKKLDNICSREIERLNKAYLDKRYELAVNELTIGKIYMELNQYESAYSHLESAYEYFEKKGYKKAEEAKKILSNCQFKMANGIYDEVDNAKVVNIDYDPILKLLEARQMYYNSNSMENVKKCDKKIQEVANNQAKPYFNLAYDALNNKNYDYALKTFWSIASIFNKANCQQSLQKTFDCISETYGRKGKEEYQKAMASLNNSGIDTTIDKFEKVVELLLLKKVMSSTYASAFEKEEKQFRKQYNYGVIRDDFDYFYFFNPSTSSRELAQQCVLQLNKCYKTKGNTIYNKAIQSYNNQNYQSALNMFEQAKNFYSKCDSSKDVVSCDDMINKCRKGFGYIHYQQGVDSYNNKRYNEAIGHFKDAIQKYKAGSFYNDANNCKDWVDSCYETLGNIKYNEAKELFSQGRYESAINRYNEASQLYESGSFYNNSRNCKDLINSCYEKLGDIKFDEAGNLFSQEKYESAIDYYNEAYKIYGYAGDRSSQQSCKCNIDYCNNAIQADNYYDSAVELYNKANGEESSRLKYDEYVESLNYFEKAKNKYSSCGLQDKVRQCYQDIEDCKRAIDIAKSNIAIDLCDRANELWDEHNDEASKLLDEAKEWDDDIF